jgi:DNA-binding beta-propeller fold protein YncE
MARFRPKQEQVQMQRTVLILGALLLFVGCATLPPEKEIETVVFYPPLPQRPRLQFLYAISGEDDLGRKQSAFDEYLLGKTLSAKVIGKSYDIGSSHGKIYVMDRKYKKLLTIDLANRQFGYLRDQRLGTLNDPSGIWVTSDDVKFIADMRRKQIVVFDGDNNFLRVYGDKTLFDKPVDVAVYGNTVYVCDMDKNRILVLDKGTGRLKMTIGETGNAEGQFYKPTHVVVDYAGNIFVNDAFNFRIQKFDPQGRFIKSFGFLGDNLGAFARPKGLDIDKEGHLYVADAAFANVQIFDEKSAQLLLFFGGAGTAPGSMYLPAGVHIDYDNVAYFSNFVDKDFRLKYLLYVGNLFGQNKLNVYGFGDWIGQPLSGEKSQGVEQGSESKKVP